MNRRSILALFAGGVAASVTKVLPDLSGLLARLRVSRSTLVVPVAEYPFAPTVEAERLAEAILADLREPKWVTIRGLDANGMEVTERVQLSAVEGEEVVTMTEWTSARVVND